MNQNFDAFRKAVDENPAIQQEAIEITGQAKAIDYSALAELGKRHGYVFTPQDISQYYQETTEDDELSDFELEMVAAGNTVDCGNSSGGR
jgi:predicted ribosomally synthesized peptide with nif11-like leader